VEVHEILRRRENQPVATVGQRDEPSWPDLTLLEAPCAITTLHVITGVAALQDYRIIVSIHARKTLRM